MLSYESNIWKMYMFRFIGSLFFISGILVPFFTDWGNITYMQIMLLQAFFLICVFALEIPTGAIADRFGRKISIALGALSATIAALVYTAIPHIFSLMIGEFFWALGAALVSGAEEAVLYDTLKKIKREKSFKKIIARYTSFFMLGIFIAGPIGSVIAAKIGLRYAVMLMAVPMFLSMLVALTIAEPPVKKRIEKPDYMKTLLGGIRYFKGHRILKILAFDMVLVSVFSFMIIWTYQPLLLDLKVKLIYLGFVVSAMVGLQILIMNNFEKLENLFGSKLRYIRISAVIAAVSFIILGITNLAAAAVVFIVLVSAFGISREILFRNYMNKHIESETRATVISSIEMLHSLVQGIFYIILGLLVSWSLKYTHIILGLLILATVIFSKVEEGHLLD